MNHTHVNIIPTPEPFPAANAGIHQLFIRDRLYITIIARPPSTIETRMEPNFPVSGAENSFALDWMGMTVFSIRDLGSASDEEADPAEDV